MQNPIGVCPAISDWAAGPPPANGTMVKSDEGEAGYLRLQGSSFGEFQSEFSPFHGDRTLPTRVPQPPTMELLKSEGGVPGGVSF